MKYKEVLAVRRLLVLPLCLVLLLSGCARDRAEKPEPVAAVFALHHPSTLGRQGTVTILVVDPAERSVLASLPVEQAFVASDVSTAPGTARVIVGKTDGFVEIDLESREVSLLASTAPGETPLGADYMEDGTAVVWHATAGKPGLVVRHLSGPTETSATVDYAEYARVTGTAPQGPQALMLMSADDANAYFVGTVAVPATGRPLSSLWRADFREGIVTQAGPQLPWPKSFPTSPEARPEEPIKKWGIPHSAETTGVVFVGLDGEELSSLTSVPMSGEAPAIVFEPGGDTFFVLDITRLQDTAGVRITHRSMVSEEERVVASETVPARGGIHPLGLIDDAFAYAWVQPSAETTSMWSKMEFQLRFRDVGSGRDATVVSMPYIVRYPPRITYLGTYQLR